MKENGGPAFPVVDGDLYSCYGMSLRDYFAAAALPQLQNLQHKLQLDGHKVPIEEFVNLAYEVADAMLAERSK